MKDNEMRLAAKEFAAYWKDKGYEKGESQPFWIELLGKVFGVENPTHYITFEEQVKLDHTSFIDGHIAATHVLIEQKGRGKDLRKAIKQSDGSLLTPFQQAQRYSAVLPYSQRPRWIVTCNFEEFLVYDMEKPNGEPEQIFLKDLEKEYYRLQFLTDTGDESVKREMEVSIQAGNLVGILYDEILKQYIDKTNPRSLQSLNMLCVRLVFCLYAEDAGIFGGHNKFHNYIKSFSGKDMRKALIELFKILDTKPEDRDPYEEETLASFPYVNGGLFQDENIEIPQMNDTIRDLLLRKASEDFDWSAISPTIFGAVFESTLNPETRRSGGMHYTSIENIHKVIDPLFLDELRAQFAEIKEIAVERTRTTKLKAFQDKLSSLTFLDPACGSGNFLTETYISLRRLENDVLRLLSNQITMFSDMAPIKVSIGQFYGIEINDFAVTVAKTALWIAESQMMKETEDILHTELDFLPLKSYANIIEGNALRIEWESVVPKDRLDYIMGNPPFVGYSHQTKEQKKDLLGVLKIDGKVIKGAAKLDYVVGWYYKAIKFMQNTIIECAFVSTNSIVQGEQPEAIWLPLLNKFTEGDDILPNRRSYISSEINTIHINFAYTPFKWKSESTGQATVHCVIIGFSFVHRKNCLLYSQNIAKKVDNINHYLLPTDNIFIAKRKKPLYDVPEMMNGNRPTDDGALSLTEEECNIQYSVLPKYVKQFVGSKEYLHNIKRYCFWVEKQNLQEIKNDKFAMDRFALCRDFRSKSTKEGTRKCADTPYLFQEIRQPNKDFVVLPVTTSEQRKYIPLGYLSKDIICSNALMIIPNADIYHFGVLISNVHMAWMRAFTGRLEMRYQYSASVVYNNFPWCNPTKEQKKKIEQTAQAILDARALYPDCSLSELYGNEMWIYPELLKAHRENDKAVMEAYGFDIKTMTESSCVTELVRLYLEKTNEQFGKLMKNLKL